MLWRDLTEAQEWLDAHYGGLSQIEFLSTEDDSGDGFFVEAFSLVAREQQDGAIAVSTLARGAPRTLWVDRVEPINDRWEFTGRGGARWLVNTLHDGEIRQEWEERRQDEPEWFLPISDPESMWRLDSPPDLPTTTLTQTQMRAAQGHA